MEIMSQIGQQIDALKVKQQASHAYRRRRSTRVGHLTNGQREELLGENGDHEPDSASIDNLNSAHSNTEITQKMSVESQEKDNAVVSKFTNAIKLLKMRRLFIAPDGKIPNSFIIRDVKKWKADHGIYDPDEIVVRVQNKEKDEEEERERQRQRDEEFKNKVRDIMNNMTKVPEVKFEPVVEEKPPEPEPVVEAEVEQGERPTFTLPDTIERLMHYYWFDEDDVYLLSRSFTPSWRNRLRQMCPYFSTAEAKSHEHQYIC
jgi:hypothetical protein